MKDAARGRFWFLETELKAGTAVRMDKTGKSILMLLRHLGRLQEVGGCCSTLLAAHLCSFSSCDGFGHASGSAALPSLFCIEHACCAAA